MKKKNVKLLLSSFFIGISPLLIVTSCAKSKPSKDPIVPEIPNPPADDSINISDIPKNFLVENRSLQIDNFYDDKINYAIEQIKVLKNDFDNNLDQIAKNFVDLINNLSSKSKHINNQTNFLFNISELELSRNQTNKIFLLIQSKYLNWMFSIDIINNIFLEFNELNVLKNINTKITNLKKFSSLIYKKKISEFIYEGIKRLSAEMSDIDKIVALSNYVCSYINYSKVLESGSDLYDSLFSRNGYCRDYTELFSILLNVVGIQNYMEYGYSINLDGTNNGYHVWNVVFCNNKWNIIDLSTADYFYNTYRNINSAGPSIAYDLGFLVGKDKNTSWKTINSTMQTTPLISNFKISKNNDINEYINSNSSFLYEEYFSEQSVEIPFQSISKNNLFPQIYFQGKWYLFEDSSLGGNYKTLLYSVDLVSGQKEQVASFAGKINNLECLAIDNTFIFIITDKNLKRHLVSLSITNDNVLNNTFELNNLSLVDIDVNQSWTNMYVDNNNLILNDKKILDLNTIIDYQKKSLDVQYLENLFSSLGQIWKSATTFGNKIGQFPIEKYNEISSLEIKNEQELRYLISFIKKDSSELIVKQNLPTSLSFDSQKFLNEIQDIYGYFKLNFFVEPENYFDFFIQPTIEYKWYKNDILFSSSLDNGTLIFNKMTNEEEIENNILGKWYCIATNLDNGFKVKSNELIISHQADVQNFYPYSLFLINDKNIKNENLKIEIINFKIWNNAKVYFDLYLNNQALFINKQIEYSTDKLVIYEKDFNKLTASDFGNYTIKIKYIDEQGNIVNWEPTIFTFYYFL